MKNYSTPEDLLQAILNYLGTKPYQEVYQLVQAIQSCQPIADEAEALEALE